MASVAAGSDVGVARPKNDRMSAPPPREPAAAARLLIADDTQAQPRTQRTREHGHANTKDANQNHQFVMQPQRAAIHSATAMCMATVGRSSAAGQAPRMTLTRHTSGRDRGHRALGGGAALRRSR